MGGRLSVAPQPLITVATTVAASKVILRDAKNIDHSLSVYYSILLTITDDYNFAKKNLNV
jgi:hypothetical protein